MEAEAADWPRCSTDCAVELRTFSGVWLRRLLRCDTSLLPVLAVGLPLTAVRRDLRSLEALSAAASAAAFSSWAAAKSSANLCSTPKKAAGYASVAR